MAEAAAAAAEKQQKEEAEAEEEEEEEEEEEVRDEEVAVRVGVGSELEHEQGGGPRVPDACFGDGGGDEDMDLAPALLSLHPHGKHVVLAVGPHLRIFNLQERCPVNIDKGISQHKDSIRAVKFSRQGNLFASAGDDKLVKLWDTESWRCIKILNANKKVTAVSFSHNGEWLLYADKFGVVYVVSTKSIEHNPPSEQSVQLLAHCCSIITSMECSVDGRFVITGDRDFKIRISVFPKNPLNGAHEIEGFCLGHTSFVSCISSVGEESPELLVSGGGDGTIRLWDVEAAKLLDTFHAAMEAGLTRNIEVEEQAFPVMCIAVSRNGSLIAVGIESFDGVLLLGCNVGLKKLSFLQKLLLPEHFCPTSLQFSGKEEQVWVVSGGASRKVTQKLVTWVKVLSYRLSGTRIEIKVVEKDSVQGGCQLFETIDGIESDHERARALGDRRNFGLKKQLSKRQYSDEHREYRKRMRNDKKLKRPRLG